MTLVCLDFDGVLTTGTITWTPSGQPQKSYHVRDGLAISLLQQAAIHVGVISGFPSNSSTTGLLKHLGITRYALGVHNKANVLDQWLQELQIDWSDVVFVGDDINDIDVMNKAGLSFCPADAHPQCKAWADVETRASGGRGCVREVAEAILLRQRLLPQEEDPTLVEVRNEVRHQLQSLRMGCVRTIAELIATAKGNVICTGVGKSANLAKHCSDLLKSISVPCFFLDCGNSLHGDIGVLQTSDVVLMFSKSGQTPELLELIPLLKQRRCTVVGVCCDTHSAFATQCDVVYEAPFQREISGDISTIPTNSCIAQLIFCNLLVTALKNAITNSDYKTNHPAGNIGQRLKTIKDVLYTAFPRVVLDPDGYLSDVLLQMTEHRIGCCFFVDKQDRLLGILTDGDIRRLLLANRNQTQITTQDINPDFAYETDLSKLLQDCVHQTYFPVLANSKLVGVVAPLPPPASLPAPPNRNLPVRPHQLLPGDLSPLKTDADQPFDPEPSSQA